MGSLEMRRGKIGKMKTVILPLVKISNEDLPISVATQFKPTQKIGFGEKRSALPDQAIVSFETLFTFEAICICIPSRLLLQIQKQQNSLCS